VKKAFSKLEKAARGKHLTVTEGEIKYMRTANWNRVYSTANIKIGSSTFESIYFDYLGWKLIVKTYDCRN